MSRSAVLLLLVGALACDRSPAMPPELADAIRAEVSPALIAVMRAPIGAPDDAADADADADYAIARAALSSLPPGLGEKARIEHGRFGKPDAALPPALVAALDDPAATTIVAAVARGAARRYVTSPFSLARSIEQRPADYLSIADVVLIAARGVADRGDRGRAFELLVALARMGQDLGRRADLAGLEVGAKIETAARRRIAEIAARLPAAESATVVGAASPALGLDLAAPTEILIDVARHRLGLAAIAAGLQLGIPQWSGRSAGSAIAAWLGPDGDPVDGARRTLAEIAGYRALAGSPRAGDIVATCERAWRAGFAPCADLATRVDAVVAQTAAARDPQK